MSETKNIRVGLQNESALNKTRRAMQEQKQILVDSKKAFAEMDVESKKVSKNEKERLDYVRQRIELERKGFEQEAKAARADLNKQFKSNKISGSSFDSRSKELDYREQGERTHYRNLDKLFKEHIKGLSGVTGQFSNVIKNSAMQMAGGNLPTGAVGGGMMGGLSKAASNPYILAAMAVIGAGAFHVARGMKMDKSLGDSGIAQLSGLGFRSGGGYGLDDYVGSLGSMKGRMNRIGMTPYEFIQNASTYGRASGGMLGNEDVMSLSSLEKATLLGKGDISSMQSALRYSNGGKSGGIMRAIGLSGGNSVTRSESFNDIAALMAQLGESGNTVGVSGLLQLQASLGGAGFTSKARSNMASKMQAGSRMDSDDFMRAIQFNAIGSVGGNASMINKFKAMEQGWGDKSGLGAKYNRQMIGDLIDMGGNEMGGVSALKRKFGIDTEAAQKLRDEYLRTGLKGYGEKDFNELIGKGGGFEGEAGDKTSTTDVLKSIKDSIDSIESFLTTDKAGEAVIKAAETVTGQGDEEGEFMKNFRKLVLRFVMPTELRKNAPKMNW